MIGGDGIPVDYFATYVEREARLQRRALFSLAGDPRKARDRTRVADSVVPALVTEAVVLAITDAGPTVLMIAATRAAIDRGIEDAIAATPREQIIERVAATTNEPKPTTEQLRATEGRYLLWACTLALRAWARVDGGGRS